MAETRAKTLTTKYALYYALGIFGVQLFIGYMNTFQTEFYNKMYSAYDSNIFYASAIIIFVAKIISCIFDPLIGSMIDNSKPKKGGKIRPWILRSAFPIALLTLIIFIYIPFDNIEGAWGKVLLYGYITLTTVLWNVAMSFADIPSQGMLALLSPSAEERNVAAGFSNLGKSIGLQAPGIIVTIVMLVLDLIKGSGNYTDATYYAATAIVILIIGTLLYLLIYFKNTEAVPAAQAGKSQASVSFGDMFKEMKNNKMILIVFLIYILGFARTMTTIVTVQASGALVGVVSFFGYSLDTTSDATWLTGILGAISGIIGISIIPIINKKLGEKKTYLMFSISAFVVAMICCIFYWSLPEGSSLRYGNNALYMIMIMQFVTSFLYSAYTYIPLVMTADIVDYEYWRTGERKEGVNFAILSMAIKLSNALCVMVGLLMIAVSGYTQVMYETGYIPVATQNIIMFAFLGFSGVSGLLSAIPMLFYKIDAKTKAQMRAETTEEIA